ncbi:MAG: hypothetical protein HOM84_04970 [Thiotrichales bacterium]|jgi:uncharacterized membrane protein YagU involved in acid resistance|nr:hypothetical protein [Thiotrichales bacterium]MBT3613284.1 hypothetical protein [Thiotrichales bacterium]MBT3751811.1 hypothetical protein [Thiotrichales bacterium]MBT3838058.1 hypothetical protein [Thiotrichales bacterium]MBT4152029.1 hypothetical protein [Thiotrichales bacterium]
MNLNRAIIAGLSATALMSVVAMMAPMMGMPKMDFGDMLGTNNPMMAMPYMAGWMMHFVVGVVLAIVYALMVSNIKCLIKGLPERSSPARGVIFAMIPFVIAQSMMMPMMGNGFWSNGDMMMIMGSLIGHIVFGATLGSVYKEQAAD